MQNGRGFCGRDAYIIIIVFKYFFMEQPLLFCIISVSQMLVKYSKIIQITRSLSKTFLLY